MAITNVSSKTNKWGNRMSVAANKTVVGRWFTDFWGPDFNVGVSDELAAPDIRSEYSLHQRLRGRGEVREFALRFREAFPDLGFGATADLIAEDDYVVGQWKGGGTHTGPAFADLPVGALPAASGKRMQFTGTTVIAPFDRRDAAARRRRGRLRRRIAA
jgi:predicted ester cyclase